MTLDLFDVRMMFLSFVHRNPNMQEERFTEAVFELYVKIAATTNK
jgi:hypothetical protein